MIDWWHWLHFGDWSFNKACWPDPAGMVRRLRELGMELMVSVWPYLAEDSANYAVRSDRICTRLTRLSHDIFTTDS